MIALEPRGKTEVTIRLAEFLGRDRFGTFRAACQANGARWVPSDKTNRAPLAALPALLEAFRDAGLEFYCAPELTGMLEAQAREASAALDAGRARLDATDAALAEKGLALFGFQRRGVEWLAPRERAILADDMGLGKSAQALLAAPGDAPAIAVVPSVVRYNWARECEKWRPDLAPYVVLKRTEFRWPRAGELVIVTYGMLPDTPPAAPDGATLIADEVHACKSSKALRTQRFGRMRDAVLAAGGRVWGLTGTPLLNRPVELWSVARAAGLAEIVFGSWREFTRLFNGHKNRWGGWDWGSPETGVADALRRGMLRRTKREVLPDLPAKTRRDVEVEIDAKTRRVCDEVLELLRERGIDLEAVGAEVEPSRLQGVSFEELSRARAALATAKLPALLELVSAYEEAEEPLVVFSRHREPVDALEGREGWAVITGSTGADERGRIVERFQAGELRGVAGTIGAMGVGVTLTRASQMIMVDLEWTPALNEQAEDRLVRIGQTRGVLVTRLMAQHALDKRVAQILGQKEGLIAASVEAAAVGADDAGSSTVDELARAAEVAAEASEAPAPKPAPKPLAQRLKAPPAGEEPERSGAFRGPKDAIEEHAALAILELAALDPDRASDQNGAGFNSADGEFGHSLAQSLRAYARLSDKQWSIACRLVRKYHRQVGRPPEEEVA